MSVDPYKASRFGGSKSRTGCSTCKSRHLKCDEGQPSCRRCIKSGRECKPGRSAVGELKVVHYVSFPTNSLNTSPLLNREERRLFHAFRTRTGLELAGVHGPEFWLRYAVCMALSEPAIKHAILSLSAHYERFRLRRSLTVLDEYTTYALRQYTKAISTLTESIKTGSLVYPDTPLVACVLFCAYESISYHLHSAISHAVSGIKLFAERQGSLKALKESSIPAYVLSPLYTRLDIQGLELGDTSFVYQAQLQGHLASKLPLFKSIEEAQWQFDELTNAILHAIHDVDRELTSDLHALDRERSISWCRLQDLIWSYRRWSDYFDKFVSHGASSDDIAPCLLLQTWRYLVEINLRVDLGRGEMDFDCFDAEFQAITDLCLAFLLSHIKTSSELTVQSSATPPLSSASRYGLRHANATATSMRGGYLGIHAQCTPFFSGDLSDPHALRQTTEYLLQISRSLVGPDAAVSSIQVDNGSVLLHDLEPSFCFSPGIVSSLYVTISRCRNPGIRRRALALMQRCKDANVVRASGIPIWQHVLANESSRSRNSALKS